MPETGEGLPLTAAQYGIWADQQLDPASPVYNIAEYVEIHGDVGVEVLVHAIRQVVAEADVLTMRIVEHDGSPRQLPGSADWAVRVVDLGDEQDPLRAAESWMAADVARPVDLGAGPLFGHAVFRLGERRFLWYHRVHHILLDGYGLSLIAQRVAAVYTALAEGAEPGAHGFGTLRSVVDEDLAYLDSADYHRDREFWVDYQGERPAPATLAGRSAPRAWHVTRESTDLDPRTVGLLGDVAKVARANWTQVLLAAITAYLHRMTGAPQVCLALPVMVRTGSVALRVPCMVLNVVEMWTDFAGNPTLVELTSQVRQYLRGSGRHHRYRYEQIRRDLGLVGNDRKAFGPSANIMPFDYGLSFAGSPGTVRNVSAGLVEDLAINVYDRADGAGLRIAFDGNPNAYGAAELAAHLRRFRVFLRELLDAPEEPVTERELVLPEEREQLLGDWNATDREWPDTTIPELLSARVAATPDATALVSATASGAREVLSYAELDSRIDRLAQLLHARGAGPGKVVMLLLPRTTDALVALFAVLRAGAAYLPADPDYPRRRLAFLHDDASPCLVLTTTELAPLLPSETAAVLVDDLTAGHSNEAPPSPATPDDPLYLIYTSGSTGTPKGAVITHRAMVNLFHQHRTEMIEPAAGRRRLRAALTASLAFDTSWEGLLWLLAGHELHFVDDDVRRDPRELLRYVRDERIDFLDITPTYAEELLAAGLLDPGTHRPAVIALGGEAAGPALWTVLRAEPAIATYNLYGPTECTVDTVWARLRDSPTPVIGRPVANARCYVLDPAMRLLPPGAVGELHLAGIPVGRGYHDRAELTAERFVPDPFGAPDAKLYRTGDLARWRPDGLLEYLGRADDQITIRGFRIEPGEIEAALSAHPGVSQAAVVVRGDRLVAYVVPAPGAAVPDALPVYLADSLPVHLVPSAFVSVERLPVTVNGKLDRAALPAPETERSGREPRTNRERALCALFARTLDEPDVGIDDDFFALGGHSLLAARLIGGIREEFGVRLRIGDVFAAPTVAALVKRCDTDETPAHHPWAGIDLGAEVALDTAITPEGALPPFLGEPRAVLLTGATGYLGAFLLRELLDRTAATVYCLVRADGDKAALRRIRAGLTRYRLSEDGIDRVVAVSGDLASPALGLSTVAFARLAELVEVVVHNGARVNHLEPYHRLRAANVGGTAEVLRLATTHRVKPVHFVSTCDTAFARTGNPAVLDEARRVTPDELMANGYVASKWVAEGLVLAAGERGLPVAVHRPSRVSGHSLTGAGSSDDSFWSLVRAMLLLGAAPEAAGDVDLVPVDWVTAAVIHLTAQGKTGATYHLTSPRPLAVTAVLDRLRGRGYDIETIPAAEWAQRLAEAADAGDDTLAVAATHFHEPDRDVTPVVFGRDNTRAGLAGAIVPAVHIADTVLDAYLDHFVHTGFFPTARSRV